MKKILLLFTAAASWMLSGCVSQPTASYPAVYLDPDADLELRVEDALSRMTLEEKVKILHAQSKFSSAGVPRLGIPEIWCTDGPHGVRAEVQWDQWGQAGWTNDSCTAFPALTCLAATWNTEMAALFGKSVGEEARYREKDVLLAPGVNIYRTPFNGRNFEYMGEDPCLASTMVVPYIKGVQSNGVSACVKHFALNNQEEFRFGYNANVDERALNEIYLPAFKAAVQEGGSWAVMGSYNRFKGQHCCHNDTLLNKILKQEWGFDGAVISDWGGVHDTRQAIDGGMDLEFGTLTDGLHSGASNAYDRYYLSTPYLKLLQEGNESLDVLNDKVRRVLRLIFRTAMNPYKPFGSMNSPEHLAAARQIAGEGIVLLKNDGQVLPVELESVRKIAVIGENAIKMMTVGGGSSSLKVKHEYTPLEGIQEACAASGVEVIYQRGYLGDTGGQYDGVVTGQDLNDTRTPEQLLSDAVSAASQADAVIFIGGLNKSDNQDAEGMDRKYYGLPYGQDEVIRALVQANPRTAVVIISGNAVAMPWAAEVPSIVEGWYLGSEAGHALADVLFGKVNPSGKLPFTIAADLNGYGAHAMDAYSIGWEVYYKESIFVGYRWIDRENLEPTFPFGHGLSYTTFSYGDVKLSANELRSGKTLKVTVPVTNTGSRDGYETVQLYISDQQSSLPRPVKELKGFGKKMIKAGETVKYEFSISEKDLQFYDDGARCWKAEPGTFTVLVGASSRDIRTYADFTLK